MVEKSETVFFVIVFMLKPCDYSFAFDLLVLMFSSPGNDIKLIGRFFKLSLK